MHQKNVLKLNNENMTFLPHLLIIQIYALIIIMIIITCVKIFIFCVFNLVLD